MGLLQAITKYMSQNSFRDPILQPLTEFFVATEKDFDQACSFCFGFFEFIDLGETTLFLKKSSHYYIVHR